MNSKQYKQLKETIGREEKTTRVYRIPVAKGIWKDKLMSAKRRVVPTTGRVDLGRIGVARKTPRSKVIKKKGQ